MRFYKKIIYLALFSIFLFQGEPSLAETVGVSVDQGVFSFSLNSGDKQTFSVNVQNISDFSENIKVETSDFYLGENNEIASLAKENEMNGMSQWISAEENYFSDFGSKEKKEIKFTISVPQNAGVGSHYALVLLNAMPQTEEQAAQRTVVGGRVGIHVLVNVSGDLSGKGHLENFEVPFFASKKTTMKMDFVNEGNMHYIPHGEVHVKNLITHKIQKAEVEKHFVFPGKKYSFKMEWDNASIFGAYWAQAIFIDGEKKVHVAGQMFFGKLFFPLIICIIGLIISIFIYRKKTVGFSGSQKREKISSRIVNRF